MVKIQRLFAKTNLKIPVYLLIKRLVPNGSSRFCLHHPLPLRLLREGRVQATQQAELGGRVRAGGEVKEVEVFRNVFDLCRRRFR